jgi:hypothetical protein
MLAEGSCCQNCKFWETNDDQREYTYLHLAEMSAGKPFGFCTVVSSEEVQPANIGLVCEECDDICSLITANDFFCKNHCAKQDA